MANENQPTSTRLLSLDALRGFDMFWIVGGEEIVHALYKINPDGPLRLLAGQMTHKAWTGVAFYDLIFPLFVFIVGVSLVFSLRRSLEQHGPAITCRRIVTRAALMFVLGIITYKGIAGGWEKVRVLGVLQRIALCYLFAGLLFCALRTRGLVIACAALLVSYWALLTFVPIRDINLEQKHLEQLVAQTGATDAHALFNATTNRVTGKFDDGLNLAQHLDFQYLPGRKWDGAYDPEGLLSTLPAIATCLLGVFAGLLLQNQSVPGQKKVLILFGAGAASVALGFLWGLQFPVIKKIWTSSYVLVAGGYGCLFLGAFYQIIELWRWRAWAQPFVWIGMNPITIYLAHSFIDFESIAERVVGGPVKAAAGAYGNLLLTLAVAGMSFLLVGFLYRRKIFLRL